MNLADVRDWLKTFSVAENYYIGKLDNKKQKSLGVYHLPRSGDPVVAIGGTQNSSYDITGISLLLHWNQNARETEEAVRALWNHLLGVDDVDVGNHHIQMLELLVPEPVSVGTDDAGVYEYVINFNLYYRR